MPAAAVAQHKELADAVMANIAGSTDASRLLFEIRQGCADPDALLQALQTATASDDRLRGFCRAMQKAIER